jgi:hypothetical protein
LAAAAPVPLVAAAMPAIERVVAAQPLLPLLWPLPEIGCFNARSYQTSGLRIIPWKMRAIQADEI